MGHALRGLREGQVVSGMQTSADSAKILRRFCIKAQVVLLHRDARIRLCRLAAFRKRCERERRRIHFTLRRHADVFTSLYTRGQGSSVVVCRGTSPIHANADVFTSLYFATACRRIHFTLRRHADVFTSLCDCMQNMTCLMQLLRLQRRTSLCGGDMTLRRHADVSTQPRSHTRC